MFEFLYRDMMQTIAIFCSICSAVSVGTIMNVRNQTLYVCVFSHAMVLVFALLIVINTLIGSTAINGVLTFGAGITCFIACVLFFLILWGSAFLASNNIVREDVLCASLMPSFFAVGFLLLSLFGSNAHIGVDMFFGNAENVSLRDTVVLAVSALINVLVVLVMWIGFCAHRLDPFFCVTKKWWFYNIVFCIQCVCTHYLLFKYIGVVMTMCYMIGVPILVRPTSKKVLHMLKQAILYSIFLSILTVISSRWAIMFFNVSCSTVGLSAVFMLISVIVLHVIKHN